MKADDEDALLPEYAVVRLRVGIPEHGIPDGTKAAIVEVHREPPGYELDFATDRQPGWPPTLAVSPDRVEPA